MHPPLTVSAHPLCVAEIAELLGCHTDRPLAKFAGVCNAHKDALDACFRREKAVKRRVNYEKAKVEQARLRDKASARRAEQLADKPPVPPAG